MAFSILYKFMLFSLTVIKVFGSEDDLTFPKTFLIGTATSSYQVEGGWNASGKSESVWDHFVHNRPEKIRDHSTADISCDSYHKYKEDVQLVKDTGFDHYRFSISWARILPSGNTSNVNEDGLRYYHNILDELEKQEIIPFVTLYHWDHPQILEEFGGWQSEKMAYMYADYARLIFKEFGRRVKFFLTINEPYYYCLYGYKVASTPPGIKMNGTGEYQCVHNMLKAHALAYHIYDEEFRPKFDGKVGTVVAATYGYGEPDAMNVAFEFEVGWQINPIFSTDGDYPKLMKEMVAKRSKLQGYSESRLPTFSSEWIDYIKGTSDFLGLNFYTSAKLTKLPESNILNWPNDKGVKLSEMSELRGTERPMFNPYPQGVRDLLRTIKEKYDNPPVYIMENGVADGSGTEDQFRIEFLHSYIKELLKAINEDGCDIQAYTIWSLLDSFEWGNGYQLHFGLYEVDFNDPNRKRTPKRSVTWLKAVLKNRRLLPPDYTL